MGDLISRDAVIGLLLRIKAHASVAVLYETISKEMEDKVVEIVDMFAEMLQKIPTIDAAPVVHARWNKEDGTCSACCHEACYDEWTEPKWDYDWDENLVQTGEETHIQFIFSPYCPNCGARMDGDADAAD